MENPIKTGWFGGKTLFSETPHISEKKKLPAQILEDEAGGFGVGFFKFWMEAWIF